MNWKTKVAVQFILSKFRHGESLNHRLQLMGRRYSLQILQEKILWRLTVFDQIRLHVPLRNATVVEVGTGWELLDPLLMFIFGSREIHTYDHVRHLRFSIPRQIILQLHAIKDLLISRGGDPERIDALQPVNSLDELLALAGIHYVAPGDACATGLPENSVDLFFSISVLEHVPPGVLAKLIAESRRILKPSGMGFHIIDPGDHYAELGVSKVNFLQYSDRIWDFFVQNKISYHNRLRARQFIEAFQGQGAKLESVKTRIDLSDIERLRNGLKVAGRFSGFTPEELAIHYCEIMYSFAHEERAAA